MAEFDFKELVAKAHFDYVGPTFPNWYKNNKTKFVLPDLRGITSGLILGGKYFTTLKLRHDNEEFVLPNEPLISFSLAKTIVETPTVGKYRKGSVKEYITTEDYQITLRGVCVDPDDRDNYPSQQVEQLNRLFDINDSLEVVGNKFFELFGVRNIVLRSIDWDDMASQQGMQKYTISAMSDQDFYADLNEREKNKREVLS